MRQTIPIPIITAIASPMMMGSSFPPAMPFALYVLSDFIDRNQGYPDQYFNFYGHFS